MADDHLNVAVASDGTLYAAVKTSYDTSGYPKIALLVRQPGGSWDDLYPVDESGTRGIAILNESDDSIRVVYTSSEGANDLVMKTSSASSISFGARETLISGSVNDATATKELWSNRVLVLAAGGGTAEAGFIDIGSAPDLSLVGHWEADEGSGTVLLDSSVAGNDAAISGDTTWVPGVIGDAVSFDGSGDYALAPDDPSLDITDAITIATWVRPEVAATQYLVKKAVNGATDGYELGLSSTAAGQQFFIRFNQTTSGNDFRINSVDTYALGQWSHVAATYDGAITRLYVDGDEVGSAAGPLSIASNDLSLGIGADSAGDSGLSGSMDDVRLYDRALSPSEIADLAAVNTAPLAADGSIFVLTDTPTDGIVAAIDGEADPLEFSIVDNGSLGSAVVNDSATGAFTYTPTTGATGEDSFTFKANDGEFDSNVATITVTIGTDDPSLVGHWEADEGSGTVLVDSSGAGNDAAVSGDTTWVPGVIGDAVSFDGTGDYTLAPDDPSLDITDAITIATWVRPEAAATQYLVKKASLSASPGGYELALADDASAAGQKFFVRFNRNATGDTYRLNSVADYPLDTWSHVAATYDGSFIRIYVNGAEAAPALPASIAIESNDLALRISGDTGSTSYDLNGSMDDIRLYDRAQRFRDR